MIFNDITKTNRRISIPIVEKNVETAAMVLIKSNKNNTLFLYAPLMKFDKIVEPCRFFELF